MLKQDVNYDGFEYVIHKDTQARICFGSSQPRKLIVQNFKPSTEIGPPHYNITQPSKIYSKRGYSNLASTSERVREEFQTVVSPDPCKYANLHSYATKKNCAPFNSLAARKTLVISSNNPPPTIYRVENINLCKHTKLSDNFGRPCVVPAVEIVCINYPNRWCAKCGEPFEYGDFWHRNYQEYLCNTCMFEEHNLHEIYKEKDLCSFKKIRTCTFMHRHEGTSAAIRLMPENKIKKKLRIENYLSLYMPCYCPFTGLETIK